MVGLGSDLVGAARLEFDVAKRRARCLTMSKRGEGHYGFFGERGGIVVALNFVV